MARPLAYQEEEWQLFEIQSRCQQGRPLLVPGPEKNKRIIGVLARSQELYGEDIRIYFGGSTSNHLHLLVASRTPQARANLKRHFKGNVSCELRDLLRNWTDGIWGGRSRDILVDDDALRDRVGYLGSHGVKEGLVASPAEWPGVPFVKAVTEGVPLRGVWYDRTRLDALKRAWEAKKPAKRGPEPTLEDVARPMVLKLDRLPQLAHLTDEDHRAWWREAIADGVEAHPPKHKGRPMGVERVLRQDPEKRPKTVKRSPAPRIHTRSRQRRQAFLAGYSEFVDRYRRAQDALRRRAEQVFFPKLCCMPAGLLRSVAEPL